MKLKTLKDLRTYLECSAGCSHEIIEEEELRQEAINHIKYIQKNDAWIEFTDTIRDKDFEHETKTFPKLSKRERLIIIAYIKWNNNITEEEIEK